MAAPSYEDLYNLGKAEALVRRPSLFLAEGDIADFLIAAAAAMGDKNIAFAAELFRKTFVDGALDDDLTTLADDHWAISRSPASAAQVTVVFSRPSAAAGAGPVPAGTIISTIEDATGKRPEFATNVQTDFGGADLVAPAVQATAVETGPEGNVGAGTVVNVVDSLFDSTIVVTNAALAAGGNDEQTDEELREEVRTFPLTLRRGTLPALEYGAKTIATVRVATAVEDALGLVSLFVADASGGSTAQMVADVEAVMPEWKAAGATLSVIGGAVFTQAVDLSFQVRQGTDIDTLWPAIQAAVTAYFNKLPVSDGTADNPGTIYRGAIAAAAQCVAPDLIFRAIVNTPSTDVVPTAGQLARAGAISKT